MKVGLDNPTGCRRDIFVAIRTFTTSVAIAAGAVSASDFSSVQLVGNATFDDNSAVENGGGAVEIPLDIAIFLRLPYPQ